MSTMKALQYNRPTKTLTLREIPIPKIVREDDVLVKVAFSGICGTDLHAIKGNYPTAEHDVTLGHEFCGIVMEVGSDVKNVKVGSEVTVDPYRGCFKCRHCAGGNPQFCIYEGPRNALGFFRDGGWAEYCLAPAQQVHRIPPEINLSLELACLVETLSTIQHGCDRIGIIPHDARVLIIGAGIIGILYACIFHLHGHRQCMISEPSAERRERINVLELGYQTMTPDETRAIMTEAMKDLEHDGLDYVIDCSGYAPAVEEAFQWLRKGGHLCFFGVAPPTSKISISPNQMFHKELTILGTLTNPFCYPKATALTAALGKRYLDFEKLAIETFELSDYEKALSKLASGVISKAVFKFPV
ncbi:2-deoxy-scyllo-inosamine dehydrogenase-like [Amphibalanus amphitrite]|uniref:2-deoxy-scyllo-inosamine dehydrogenase-like n=1 Tax=Amphibalanus amphitrite TaxID=1232801 RepID=UPI001C915CCF|nr:2-deoxy-scyllo-inosamine dehydrogenase-like [Amphibalanus amphitrite]